MDQGTHTFFDEPETKQQAGEARCFRLLDLTRGPSEYSGLDTAQNKRTFGECFREERTAMAYRIDSSIREASYRLLWSWKDSAR